MTHLHFSLHPPFGRPAKSSPRRLDPAARRVLSLTAVVTLGLVWLLAALGVDPGLILGVLVSIPFAVAVTFLLLRSSRQNGDARALTIVDVDAMDGLSFERYVATLLNQRGYQTRVTPGTGDFGVDIVAQKGSTRAAVQVKRQKGWVSRRAVSDAVAGKQHYRCNVAIVVTNSYFSEGARELARSTGCELVDRETLSQWMLQR